ncbi:MAG: ABC transporter permease, partial [Henriciella sp.]
ELLNSLPVSLSGLVAGKLLAAWTVAGAGLVMTLPWWIIVNYLGDTDNGVIAVSYLMSWMMAGAFLGIGSTVSALTSSSAIAFVLSVAASFLITAAGWPILSVNIDSVFGPTLSEIVSQFSFMTHFSPAQRGVVELRNIIFFVSFIGLSIFATRLLIEYRRRVPK